MPIKHPRVVLRGDVSVKGIAPNSSDRIQSTQNEAIAHALAPLRCGISNPPTAADVKAVGDTLDALLARARQ